MKKLLENLSKTEKFLLPLVFINIVAIIIYLFFKQSEYKLISTDIEDFNNVSTVKNIVMSFNKELNEDFYNSCSFTFNPEVNFTSIYKDNFITLKLNEKFEYETSYVLNVKCIKVENSLTFKTRNYKDADTDEIAWDQIKKDKDFADSYIQLYQEQPWREAMPIENDSFNLTYDQERNVYIVKNLSNKTNNQIISEIKKELEKISAPTDLEIIWKE